MANLKNLRVLNIGGVDYNVGFSTNDLTNELKAQYDAAQANVLEGVQVDGTDLVIDGSKKVNVDLATPISTAKNEAISAGALTIAEAAGSGDILKSYTFTQNGATIGTINLAKDLVVSGGEVVEVDGEKYLRLSIANQEEPVDIAVKDLVDIYKGSAYIDVAADNTISVKFNDLDAALAAETAVVGAAIKAAQGTADGIRQDLGQSTDVANAEGSAFARIKKLEGEMEALGGEEGGIQGMIDTSLADYDEKTVQPISERVKKVEDDYLKGADKSELQGNIDAKVAQSVYDIYVAANDIAVQANTTKLAGISEGANKVTHSYDEASSTLTITIA